MQESAVETPAAALQPQYTWKLAADIMCCRFDASRARLAVGLASGRIMVSGIVPSCKRANPRHFKTRTGRLLHHCLHPPKFPSLLVLCCEVRATADLFSLPSLPTYKIYRTDTIQHEPVQVLIPADGSTLPMMSLRFLLDSSNESVLVAACKLPTLHLFLLFFVFLFC